MDEASPSLTGRRPASSTDRLDDEEECVALLAAKSTPTPDRPLYVDRGITGDRYRNVAAMTIAEPSTATFFDSPI